MGGCLIKSSEPEQSFCKVVSWGLWPSQDWASCFHQQSLVLAQLDSCHRLADSRGGGPGSSVVREMRDSADHALTHRAGPLMFTDSGDRFCVRETYNLGSLLATGFEGSNWEGDAVIGESCRNVWSWCSPNPLAPCRASDWAKFKCWVAVGKDFY